MLATSACGHHHTDRKRMIPGVKLEEKGTERGIDDVEEEVVWLGSWEFGGNLGDGLPQPQARHEGSCIEQQT